jgi:hypothetical protein
MSERDDGRSNGDDRGTSPGDDPLGNDAPGDDPLGDLARRVRERRDRGTDAGDDGDSGRPKSGSVDSEHDDGGDAFADRADAEDSRPAGSEADDVDALFEEMNVAEVDPDRVWESVLDEDDDPLRDASDPGATGDADPGPGSGDASDDADNPDDGDDADDGHLVRKRAYCESCEYFTAPPEVACTYDGGEIVEVVDSDRFRVRNCPVVAGRIDTDGVALSDGDVSVDDIE